MRIVLCRNDRDRSIGEQMEAHLWPLAGGGGLDVWTDGRLGVDGAERAGLEAAIAAAEIVILLVSAEFLASALVIATDLAALLARPSEKGLRVITVFAGSVDATRYDFSAYAAANSPDRPLALLSRARRAVVFADLVAGLGQQLRAEQSAAPAEDAAAPEVIPSSGRLFDRVQDREALARFLKSSTRRACILRGFPGVGKSVLVAQMAEQYADSFQRTCWIRCRDWDDTPDALFARLDSFLQAGGDKSLQAARTIIDEAKRLEQLVRATVLALSRSPFLIVFDDFGAPLGAAHEIRNTTVSRLLTAFAATGKATKMILITDRRHPYDEGEGAIPAGTVVERELFGLPADAVRQLMKECGTPVDARASERVAGQLSGNPSAIRMLCSLASRQYLDPVTVLEASVDPRAPFTSLLARAMSDLDEIANSVLARLSLLRLSVAWDRLAVFGIGRDAVVALLDRSLLRFDPFTNALIAPELVRRFVADRMDSAARAREHARLAAGYEALIDGRCADDLESAKLRLEACHHHLAAGDGEAGAATGLPAVDALVTWGHISLAEQCIAEVLCHFAQGDLRAQALYQRGRIADRRGQHREALPAFEQAMEQTASDRLRALCLFYRGRIKSAQGDLAAGQQLLEESIVLSRRPDVSGPTAAAVLALAWARKERGASHEETLEAFQLALDDAEREGDWHSAGDAHRQLGFLGWTFSKRRTFARTHYAQALRLARSGRALPQQAAIFSELGYLMAEWGRPDMAIRHCICALKVARLVGDDGLFPSIYINLGLAYRALEHPEATKAWFSQAIEVFKRNSNPGGEAYARHELGRLLADQGHPAAARKELDKAARLCSANGLSGQLQSINATLTGL